MKRNAMFALFVLPLFFIACNSTPSKKDMLLGKWDYKSWELNGEVTEPSRLEAPSMEFKADGKYVLIAGMAVKEAVWELNGDTVKVTADGELPHSMTITELTDTTLTMQSISGEMKTIIKLVPSTKKDFLPEPEEHEEHEHDMEEEHDHDGHEGHSH